MFGGVHDRVDLKLWALNEFSSNNKKILLDIKYYQLVC